MRISVIQGVIARRILANFRIDAAVVTRFLPRPFRPKLVGGYAMGGICLIRLKAAKPPFLPFPFGLESENAAHRIAVEWDVDGKTHQGVYVPRRDTSSRLNTWAGGRIFPGVQHHAKFNVTETATRLSVSFRSDDGHSRALVFGTVAEELPDGSVFASLGEASQFFELGSVGYSATALPGKFDGIELKCSTWHLEPMLIEKVESSFFDNRDMFPAGSVAFDCGLLMRGIQHQWHSRDELCCNVQTESM